MKERMHTMREDILNMLNHYSKEELDVLNKSELARRFDCDPRTITRYQDELSGKIPPKKPTRIYESKLDDYTEIIKNKVDNYGATAMAVYKFIDKKGYEGKYSTVAAFVSKHKANEIKKATIRFETSPGLQGQVDWKENLTMYSESGEAFKINIFLMVLGYSRMKYLCLTSDRTQQTLFKCLTQAFNYFGGIPQEILFDNMKTVVDQSKTSFSSVVFNETFKHFADDAGFKPIACRPYRPQTKGKVEALAKFTNRLVVYNNEFNNYESLERIVDEFTKEINLEVSQATNETPISRLIKDKEYFKPSLNIELLQTYFSRQKEYKVTKESMITFNGIKYSVPTKYIDQKVTVNQSSDSNIRIYYNQDLIVCHQLGEKKLNYKYEHMHEILKSDACKHLNDDEIHMFIQENITKMDLFLGE